MLDPSCSAQDDKPMQPQFFRNPYKTHIRDTHEIIQIVNRGDSTMKADAAKALLLLYEMKVNRLYNPTVWIIISLNSIRNFL
jgi:hypothetical protein